VQLRLSIKGRLRGISLEHYHLYTDQFGQVQMRDDKVKLQPVLHEKMNIRYRNIFTN